MATGWESFPLELKGGLVSNISRLQQGTQAPGSARELINFEPSVKGGYRRINGFNKYSDSYIPTYGSPLVQASGQSGGTLVVANLFVAPSAEDTFTVAGVAGTYTISSSGVSYNSTNKVATLTITPNLASSPADKAAITFGNRSELNQGLHYLYDSTAKSGVTIAQRDGIVWSSTGGAWTNKSTPSYGSVLVNGGSQSGTNLIVDAIASNSYIPHVGSTFSIAGVELVYTVLSVGTISSGGGTLGVSPSLASSPSDNAAITFLSLGLPTNFKCHFENFNFDGTFRTVMVDGTNRPSVFSTTGGVTLLDGTTDIVGSSVVSEYNNHLFFGTGTLLSFAAPFTENDFASGNGAGDIRFDDVITGLVPYRDELIVFTSHSIHRLSGTSLATFKADKVSGDLGCDNQDTIKEVGGDILFLGPDGLRFLGATDRIGDFNLSLASRSIQDRLTSFGAEYTEISSIVLRGKSQYRLLGFTAGRRSSVTEGFIGTQFVAQESSSFNWSETKGVKAYRTTSVIAGGGEKTLFSEETGFVYTLDVGNNFDGGVIKAYFKTPFMSITDSRLRKTLYKVTTHYDPEGEVEGRLGIKYDFLRPEIIQPNVQPIVGGGQFSRYGSAVYGTSTYGSLPNTYIESQVTGSFFTVSLQYSFTELNTPPFILDVVILEYRNNDRK